MQHSVNNSIATFTNFLTNTFAILSSRILINLT